MNRKFIRTIIYWTPVIFIGLLLACNVNSSDLDDEASTPSLALTITETAASPTGPQSHVAGAAVDKWSLWVGDTQLRGANIYQRRVYPELDGPEFMGPGPVGPPYTQQDFYDLAALGANYVNISHPGLFTETVPYAVDLDIQNNLDNLLAMIANADMFAVLSFRTGPGRSEFTFFWGEDGDWFDASYYDDRVWEEQAAQDAWVEMWRYTAQRYKDNPIVVGYDLMVEPNANEVGPDIWDPDVFYADYGGTLYDWNQFYPDVTAAIRQVDSNTPILIGGMGYSAVEWLPYLQPTGDSRTVYTAHQYERFDYTHQEPPAQNTYPDGSFNKVWLDDLLSTMDTFSNTHGVPVAVNEFGVVRWVPGADQFMDDQMDLLEQRGLNYALWLWEMSWGPYAQEVDAFNFRHGPDPGNHTDVTQSDLMDVIVEHWGQNTIRPSLFLTFTPVATTYLPSVSNGSGIVSEPMLLQDVTHWAYQIQDISAAGAVDALVASHYDMLILEPTRTDWSSDDRYFDTRGMVTQLKNSQASDGVHRKLLIAYIDIGEAEDWRWYWMWSQNWDCVGYPPADWPDYILACDPDGWAGNYPVAYWDEDWKDIIIYGRNQGSHPDRDYDSVLDEVIKDGFDGIYLDWVEGFENADVIAAAQAVGKDPAVEMIAFIQEMQEYAAARSPNFIIIQQNAASLCDGHSELFAVIDAISQEAIWYDGNADVDWDDADGYDWPNDSSLVNYYISYLDRYLDAGLPVFDCEYALAHADTAYVNALDKGYVPYVTRRSLSQLTTTPPPGY